jgi:hypothetical protein
VTRLPPGAGFAFGLVAEKHPRPHWRAGAPPRSDRVSSVTPAPCFLGLPLASERGEFLNPFLEVGGEHERSAATFHRTQFAAVDRLVKCCFANARHCAYVRDGVSELIRHDFSGVQPGKPRRAHSHQRERAMIISVRLGQNSRFD